MLLLVYRPVTPLRRTSSVAAVMVCPKISKTFKHPTLKLNQTSDPKPKPGKKYGAKGYGFAGGAGGLQTGDL